MSRKKLRIALPSKDLQDPTERLLAATRIHVHRKSERNSHVVLSGFDGVREATFMRSSDVAEFVANGVFDVGITTSEVLAEHGRKVVVCGNLDYSRNGRQTKVVLFAHQRSGIRRLQDIRRGMAVRTEFPHLTRSFFEKCGLLKRVRLVSSRGSTEAHIPGRYPLGVCLTDSGKTLKEHGLRIVTTLMVSDTVLVANKSVYRDPRKRALVEDLQSLLMGAVNARRMRMLQMNIPVEAMSKIRAILPKREGQSPTVNPLDDGRSAIEYVVYENEINALVPKLRRAGAKFIVIGKEESVIP